MKVLLAVDGSAYTKRMLAYLAAHDELLGGRAEYTVLTVVPDIPPHAAQFLSSANIDAYYRTEGDEVLNPVKAFNPFLEFGEIRFYCCGIGLGALPTPSIKFSITLTLSQFSQLRSPKLPEK